MDYLKLHIEDLTGISLDVITAGLAALVLILIIIMIINGVKMRKLKKRYEAFMSGKNAVDSEILLGELKSRGFDIVNDAAQAEVIIVNTCGFIESAKTDSIDTILDMAQYKTAGSCKLLVVTGCLSQRYGDELAR